MKYSSDDQPGLVKVLSFLKAHDTEYLSGQDLSDVLKISRVAVWKHIRKIRELEYDVESRQKLGYRLKSDTCLLLPWEITDGLDTKIIGSHIHYFTEIDSTQDHAIMMATGTAADGTVIVAQRQSGGKGRKGRKWVSPKGGIWCSIILRPKFSVPAVTLFPMAAALALSKAIQETLGLKTELKWPNDLMLEGKKVAGMLVDASLESNKIKSLILGTGINFDVDSRHLEKQLKNTPNFYGAATLVKKGSRQANPKILVQAFFRELEETYCQLNDMRVRDIISEWTKESSTIGKKVSIDTAEGSIKGKAIRIDDDGALVVSTDNGHVRVVAGDVVHS